MDRLDQAAADQLGVGRTDLRGLEVLERLGGPMTAGHMAEQLGLTTGAATLLVDRLERAGYVQRRRDTHDRRKIYVDVTSTLQERTARLFSGVGRATARLANAYSSGQLEVIEEFIGQLVTVVGTEAGVLSRSPNLGAAPGDYLDGGVGMTAKP
jgi:DNA-binding MarR family transcriptional regulator